MVDSYPAAKRRHLASSPFQPDPEPVIEDFAVGDRVSHDSHGLGRVIGVYDAGVSVDFGDQTVHVRSPFPGMSTL